MQYLHEEDSLCQVLLKKIQILNLIEKSFEGNQNLKKLIEGSAFCSDKDEIISENYKINENQKIGIIPPIGGG